MTQRTPQPEVEAIAHKLTKALVPFCGPIPNCGGNGQGLSALEDVPIAAKQRPTYLRDRVDTAHLSLSDEGLVIQWYGRKANGYFYPLGEAMQATEETPSFLRQAAKTQPEYSRPFTLKAADEIEKRLAVRPELERTP